MKKKTVVVGVLLAGTAIAGGVGWSVMNVWADYPIMAGRLPELQKQADAAGMPTSVQAIAAIEARFPGENAAPELKALVKELESKKPLAALNASMKPPVNLASQRPLVQAASPWLDRAVAASRKPALNWERDWIQGFNLVFPEFAMLKDLSKALGVRARVRATDGDLAGMESDLLAGLRLGALCGQEPVLIAGLVGIAMQAISYAEIRACAEILAGNRDGIAALQRVAKAAPEMPSVKHIPSGEIFVGVHLARNLEQFGGLKAILSQDPSLFGGQIKTPDRAKLIASGPGRLVHEQAFQAAAIEFWLPVWRVMQDPKSSRKDVTDAIARQEESLRSKQTLSYALMHVSLPVFARVADAYDRNDATRNTTQAGLAVAAFRQQRGVWPKTLAEAGADLADPYGDRLKYIVSGQTATVYSLDMDRTDQKGAGRSSGSPGDIAFVVQASPTPTAKG